MAAVGKRNLALYRGDTYAHTITFQDADDDPIDVSAGSWLAQIRSQPNSTVVTASFTIDVADAATGVLVLHLSASQTAGLDRAGYAWDLQNTTGGVVKTWLKGDVDVARDVSRV